MMCVLQVGLRPEGDISSEEGAWAQSFACHALPIVGPYMRKCRAQVWRSHIIFSLLFRLHCDDSGRAACANASWELPLRSMFCLRQD